MTFDLCAQPKGEESEGCPYQSPIAITGKCTIGAKHSCAIPKHSVKEYALDDNKEWIVEGKTITLVRNCRTFALDKFHFHIPA